MKIYISGQISGLPIDEVKARFSEAERFLEEELDYVVVNPFDNGLPDDAPWIQHMLRDLEMLYECDAIYMLNGWQESRGACIEYRFAVHTDKQILFENERHT